MTGSVKPEQPNLAQMSDEELQQALASAPSTPKPTTDVPPKADPATASEAGDKEQPEADAEVPEPEEEKATTKISAEEENAKLKEQLRNLQQLYGRQANELGELRKKLKQKPTAEDFDADPVKAAEQLQEHKEQIAEINRREQEQQLYALAIRNMEFIATHAPDLKANAPIIREVLANEDKVSDEDIQNLYANIYLHNPWGVYQLNQRAKLYAENKRLRAEIEKLKEAPKKAVSKIADINKIKSNVGAATGHSAEPDKLPISSTEIRQMSSSELEERLKQLMKGS